MGCLWMQGFGLQILNPQFMQPKAQARKLKWNSWTQILKPMHWIQNHNLFTATRVTSHDDNHRLWNHCIAEPHLHSEAYNNKYHKNNRDLMRPIYRPPLSFLPGKFCIQNISCNGAFADTWWADKLPGFVRPPDE